LSWGSSTTKFSRELSTTGNSARTDGLTSQRTSEFNRIIRTHHGKWLSSHVEMYAVWCLRYCVVICCTRLLLVMCWCCKQYWWMSFTAWYIVVMWWSLSILLKDIVCFIVLCMHNIAHCTLRSIRGHRSSPQGLCCPFTKGLELELTIGPTASYLAQTTESDLAPFDSTLVSHSPIVEHRIVNLGACSWERQRAGQAPRWWWWWCMHNTAIYLYIECCISIYRVAHKNVPNFGAEL